MDIIVAGMGNKICGVGLNTNAKPIDNTPEEIPVESPPAIIEEENNE